MAVADVLRTLVVAGAVSTGPLAPPSELVIDDIPGFELTSGPATDLDFAEFATIEPASVAHIEPDSEEAAGLVAAMQTWADADQAIVVEIVRALDDEAAATFVDQAAANSIAVGLGAVDPPFSGAWSYSGGVDDSWRNVVAWAQGSYAVIMTQSSAAEADRSAVDGAALRQVEAILAATGAEVSADAAVDDEAPTPPTDAPPAEDEEDDGGFPVGSLLVVILVVGVGLGVMLQQRRRVWGRR